jgi:hypothetical protein
MPLDQIVIAIAGSLSIWLSQQNNVSWQKWASVVGLLCQPAWFYAAYTSQQWGILFATVLYTYAWGVGFWNTWLAGCEYRHHEQILNVHKKKSCNQKWKRCLVKWKKLRNRLIGWRNNIVHTKTNFI